MVMSSRLTPDFVGPARLNTVSNKVSRIRYSGSEQAFPTSTTPKERLAAAIRIFQARRMASDLQSCRLQSNDVWSAWQYADYCPQRDDPRHGRLLVAKLNSEVPSARFVPLGTCYRRPVRPADSWEEPIFFSTSTNDSLEDRVALNLSAVSHVLTTLGMQAK